MPYRGSEQATDTKVKLGMVLAFSVAVFSSSQGHMGMWGWASLIPNSLSCNILMNIQTQADR